MGVATDDAAATADRLRAVLVDGLRDQQLVRAGRVEAAQRAVPRHLFVPEVPVETAYANEPIYTKQDGEGVAVSAASQPSIVAMMLASWMWSPVTGYWKSALVRVTMRPCLPTWSARPAR
ncbi:MAG: hypothetical protein ACRDRI_03230 [Pseudonocardiaceae bacterium]